MAFVAPDGSEFDSRDGLREYLLESGFLEFRDKQGSLLVKSVGDIDGEGFALSKLSGCEIVLLDHIEQITIENLANCKVFVGPCKGSCYVRECKDCLFTVMCNQLRIIKCEECIFFTHVKTDPVIEQSKRLHFGAYNGPKTSEISALAMLSGFDLDQQSKWRSVFDLTEEKSSPRQRDWVLVEEHQALFDVRTAAVSPLGHCILRDLFWRLDDDHDGGLSYLELNAFQRMIGSNETVESAEELREKFQEVGLPLDVNGNLPFDSFLELYQLQGEDGLLQDLDKLGLDPTSAPCFDIYAVIQRSKLMLPISSSCPPPTYHHATRQPFDQESSSCEEYDEEDFVVEQGDFTARTSTGAETEKLTALAASNQVHNPRKSSEKVIERSLLPEKPPKKHETVSEMQLHDGTQIELNVEPTSRANMVVQDARSLCAEAKRRGVNLRMWFESYGHGGVSFLPCKTFETAFSALLLGLCAGSGEDFIRTVEYVLAPEQLSVLCNALRDTNVRDGIDFAGLLPQPRGGSNSPMRKLNRARLSTPIESNVTTAKPVSKVVNEPVEQFLVNLFKNMQQKEESNELFEKLRDAIQSWKWSEGGRMPTRGGGTWSTQREFITIGNLRSALRASLQADFSIELVSSFVDMIEQVVESDTEAKARYREQCDLSKHGHPLGGSPDNYTKAPLSPASQSPHEAETNSICSNEPRDMVELRHKLATVPALIRWITSIRVAKSIPRDAWLHSKANAEKREDERRKARLEAALTGDKDMLSWLMERENRKELEDTLAASPDFIPKESIHGEAQVRAKNILAGPSGESLLRKRVIQLSNREKAPVSTMKLESVAKTQLVDELAVEQEHALRHDLEARVDLFLVYARGRMSGLVTASFTSWLQHREADREKRRKTLQEWQKKKEESVRVHRSEEQWVCVASTVFSSLRNMVNQTCVQLREEKSGVLINRSSRYKGLDAEAVISQLTKAKVEEYSRKPNSKPLDVAHAEVAAIAAGEFVITHNQVRKSFDGILTSLLADAKTHDEALALLDPIAAAKKKQKAMSGTEVSRNSEEDGNQLLAEVFEKAGFTKVGSKEEMDRLLHTAQGKRRKKADMEFKKWKKEKAKKERTRRKLEAAQAKLSKEEELKRTTKSKKAYSRWKKAAAQNKYISFKASESSSGTSKKLRSVARPRISKPSREEVEKLLERPTWVESLEDSHSVNSVERENVDA